MATIQGLVSVHIQDAYGITGTTPAFVEVDDTKTIAQLITDVVTFSDTVSPLTQGAISKATVTLIAIDTPGGTAFGDIEKGGLFNFSNATDPYATGVLIPDINPSVLNSSGLIDLTNTSVTNFITFMTTAHTVMTVVTKGVRALNGLLDALITFRKHRKPLSRKTKEKG